MCKAIRQWGLAGLLAGGCLTALPFDRPAAGAELAMGFRVGEVTQDSAIVWTRVTREPARRADGYRDPAKRPGRNVDPEAPQVAVEDREGAVPGAPGEVRVLYSTSPDLGDAEPTRWVAVEEERDFVHQFQLDDLRAGRTYHLRVEARDGPGEPISASVSGSFTTPAEADEWQDVRFAVITGQSYWDLDHPDGYRMYPAMQNMNLSFLVPTGDSVYLDSETPRATTIPLARYHWHRMYSLPRLVEFHRNVPGYWEVDDHDIYCNDCWPSMQARFMLPLTYADGDRVYREQIPLGEMKYRTIRWGRGLQIWLVEGRDFRSPNNAPDGPEKTIWGEAQKEWLTRTILESDAEFRVLISPTPIVGPDRSSKADNHSNNAFAHEGNWFRNWTREQELTNFFVCCGDRHWQYYSVDPATGLREFSCGPASDVHAGGTPGANSRYQPFHKVQGGFLTVEVRRVENRPEIVFRHHGVDGDLTHQALWRH